MILGSASNRAAIRVLVLPQGYLPFVLLVVILMAGIMKSITPNFIKNISVDRSAKSTDQPNISWAWRRRAGPAEVVEGCLAAARKKSRRCTASLPAAHVRRTQDRERYAGFNERGDHVKS